MKRKPTPEGHSGRGHVIQMDPTAKQRQALARACGAARFTYNWALAEWRRQYAAGEKPSAMKLKQQFNAVKVDLFPWVMDSPRDANSQPFADLGAAYNNFFASCKGSRAGKKMRYPQFKKKGKCRDAFYVANDKFSLRRRGGRAVVRLPVIGDIRLLEHLRFSGRILSGRVFRQADRWFLAVQVEMDCRIPNSHARETIGVDLGIKTAAHLSSGLAAAAPKPLRKNLKKLKRLNRRLHRRQKGSRNRDKARRQVAGLHYRIANQRKDFWHKITTSLVRENQTVVVEDMSMQFMLGNRRLARAAHDAALGMFRLMLVYKAPQYGTNVIVASKWFPSTQRCSCCGDVKTGDARLGLKDRLYVCFVCGLEIDRDLNAALNLEQYPGLQGNWIRKDRTPMDDQTSTELQVQQAQSPKWEPNRATHKVSQL